MLVPYTDVGLKLVKLKPWIIWCGFEDLQHCR